jgi:hypothetical protein
MLLTVIYPVVNEKTNLGHVAVSFRGGINLDLPRVKRLRLAASPFGGGGNYGR